MLTSQPKEVPGTHDENQAVVAEEAEPGTHDLSRAVVAEEAEPTQAVSTKVS